MRKTISALIAGILFGIGLVVSEMVNPLKVLGFLDIGGHWDANLALVMISALAVTIPSFWFILKRPTPLFAKQFHIVKKNAIDTPLLTGAIVFGIGWGLSGYCPGPGLINLLINPPEAMIFLPAMLLGGWVGNRLRT